MRLPKCVMPRYTNSLRMRPKLFCLSSVSYLLRALAVVADPTRARFEGVARKPACKGRRRNEICVPIRADGDGCPAALPTTRGMNGPAGRVLVAGLSVN